MISEPVLSHITFDLEVDDHKPVDFRRETLSFTCQFVKGWSSHNEMNLDMIRPRSKTEVFEFFYLKTVKRLSNKLSQKHKERLILKIPNQEKFFL